MDAAERFWIGGKGAVGWRHVERPGGAFEKRPAIRTACVRADAGGQPREPGGGRAVAGPRQAGPRAAAVEQPQDSKRCGPGIAP